MTFLSACFLAGWFPQARDPRRLLQPVARRWLAAVAAVQSEPTFQFGDAGVRCGQRLFQRGILCLQRRHSLVLRDALRQQQLNLFNQLLDVGGSFHPTLESDSLLRYQLLHTARVNSPQQPSTGGGSTPIAFMCPGTWGVTKIQTRTPEVRQPNPETGVTYNSPWRPHRLLG